MANFEEIAKAAKAKSEGIVDAELKAKRDREEAEDRRLSHAEGILRDNVLPVLQSASAAFERDGISLQIEELALPRIIDPHRGLTKNIRAIIFGCYARLESDSAGLSMLRGDRFIIEHDGSMIIAQEYGSTHGTRFTGDSLHDFVTRFVVKALDSYYEKLRTRHT